MKNNLAFTGSDEAFEKRTLAYLSFQSILGVLASGADSYDFNVVNSQTNTADVMSFGAQTGLHLTINANVRLCKQPCDLRLDAARFRLPRACP